jgi:hypothetical protein
MILCIFIIIYLSVLWKFLKWSSVTLSKKGWESLVYIIRHDVIWLLYESCIIGVIIIIIIKASAVGTLRIFVIRQNPLCFYVRFVYVSSYVWNTKTTRNIFIKSLYFS